MYIQLIEKEKVLGLLIDRGGGQAQKYILIEYIKKKSNNKAVLESTVREQCYNLELIGEKSRKNGGSCYRIPQMIYKINSIPIDDFKKTRKY